MGGRKSLVGLLIAALCVPLVMALAAESQAATLEETTARKKLYKWVDREGNVSYHDQPPPDDASYKVEERFLKGSKMPSKKVETDDNLARAAVVMYMIPKCMSCDMARAYLQRRKIPFTEKNVEGNRVLLDELRKKSGTLSVPTILVGDKVMQGYLESLLAGELDAAGYPPEPPVTSADEGKPDTSPAP